MPAALPDVHARLQADPPARVADLGCGAGWASIAIARAYLKTTVDGFDLDVASVALASRNVAEAGVQDRVHIIQRDAADPALAGRYDLVLASAVVHDTPQPVAMLQTMRRLAGDAGVVLVSEPKSGERFLDAASNVEVERSHFAISVLHCLPVGMAEQPSAGTGTMMRPDILRDTPATRDFTTSRSWPSMTRGPRRTGCGSDRVPTSPWRWSRFRLFQLTEEGAMTAAVAPVRLLPERLGEAAAVMGRALVDDPLFVALLPDAQKRVSGVPLMMEMFLRIGLAHGELWVMPPPITGVACWLPPAHPTIT